MERYGQERVGWMKGYGRFLTDRHESALLKLAPLAMAAGFGEVVASNLLPVVGEVEDVGAVAVAALVAVKTFSAIRRHR